MSKRFEDQGSVTADQPSAPFVALVAVALLGAAFSAGWANRILRTR